MHIVIFFNDSPQEYPNNPIKSNLVDSPEIKLITVAGSVHPEVCDSFIAPDLRKYAKRFVKKIFKPEQEQLSLTTEPIESLSIGAADKTNYNQGAKSANAVAPETSHVTGVTLCGASRGGALCFEVARQLFKIDPKIPVDIVAVQPVPGNIARYPFSNARRVDDCSALENLKHVSVVLGANTGGEPDTMAIERMLHRAFFKQIVPKIPKNTEKEVIVIAENVHQNAPWRSYLNTQLAHSLHRFGLLSEAKLNTEVQSMKESVKLRKEIFPPRNQLQPFFGISNKELYLHLDELHHNPYLRQGMEWDAQQETLLAWWDKHQKGTSLFLSAPTEQLIAQIKQTDIEDKASLIELFKAADQWFIRKENRRSSRDEIVTALLGNLYEHLIKQNMATIEELYEMRYRNALQHNYFQDQWQKLSQHASLFKSPETEILDQAFDEHASGRISLNELITQLKTWKEQKLNVSTKRWEIVNKMLNQLRRFQRHLPVSVQEEKHNMVEKKI